MNNNDEFLDKINEEIKKYEDELKKLGVQLQYHKEQIKFLANSIVIYETYHNVPSMHKHFVEIGKIEAKAEILEEALWFLKDLKEDIRNEKEL